ncbi:MAG: Maf-like protein [Prevotellaceae bacterium]|nr:Maf-like protein [Prevotellaceae bacterium]
MVSKRPLKLILSSNSPRRKELLGGLDLPFEVRVIAGIDESYPPDLAIDDIPLHIAKAKASAYLPGMADDEVILTADTIVALGERVLGKPRHTDDALAMLHLLSGCTHRVVTGVCLTTRTDQRSFSVVTEVTFRHLSTEEIDYYVDRYRPLDKAGSYGIQEWIGYVGVTGIKGSYFNVVGLPVQRIYEELKDFVGIEAFGR